MMTGPPTEAARLVSACIALCKSQPEKSEATRDDELQLAHIGTDQSPIMTGQSISA